MATNERALRFETAIATFVGFLALMVSGYAAYEQHLQVRAQVWPILQIVGGNEPIHVAVANKGGGPALVRDVVMRVDGTPVKQWREMVVRLLDPATTPRTRRR
jgi:hypothetical protein